MGFSNDLLRSEYGFYSLRQSGSCFWADFTWKVGAVKMANYE